MDLVTPILDKATNPFVETVDYRKAGIGPPKAIDGIFDEPFTLTSLNGIDYQNAKPQVHVATADVPEIGESDTIERGGIVYKVIEIQPDGSGWLTLVLSKD